MPLETIFSVANLLAGAGWLALILLPRYRWVAAGISGFVAPVLLSIACTGLIAAFWAGAEGGFSSLAQVELLFQTPGVLLAVWLHFLAFDLFIGAWQVRTAQREGIRHLLILPALVLTFLFGPAGLLLFLVIRTISAAHQLREV